MRHADAFKPQYNCSCRRVILGNVRTWDHPPKNMVYDEVRPARAMQQMSAIFRTQRVNRISFALTAEALTALVDCENGEASDRHTRRIVAGCGSNTQNEDPQMSRLQCPVCNVPSANVPSDGCRGNHSATRSMANCFGASRTGCVSGKGRHDGRLRDCSGRDGAARGPRH